MAVDGRLDEPEWQQAQRFENFQTTQPYTLAAPELATTVLVHSDERGIYFGFICAQPAAVERVRTKGQRDEFIAGDRVNLMLDLEGRGGTGYEFTVYLSNQLQDSIISGQLIYNYDWDADVEHATSETETAWFVEYRLPWTVAAMSEPQDGQHTIGVFFSRVVASNGRRYSFPAHQFERPTFVADMHKIRIKGYSAQQLDLFPYLSSLGDFEAHDSEVRGGFDLFWKPSTQHQLTAAVNPDFGQVESDDLVVNFSAIETFFSDKRPFFTENFGLFSTDNRVVNTRRVGARPDAGAEGVTDILGALKYTGNTGAWEYGLVTALEDDSTAAEGRDFYVGRARRQFGDSLKLGWLGTHVERPTRDRRASVQSADFEWTLAPGQSLRGQGLVSQVERPTAVPDTVLDPDGEGRGATLRYDYAPGGVWQHSLFAHHFDQRLQINDAGFLPRNNLNRLNSRGHYYWRGYAANDPVEERSLFWNLVGQRNNQGQRLGASVIFEHGTTLRDTSSYFFNYTVLNIGGADDRITRGNGPVKKPARHEIVGGWGSPKSGRLRYNAALVIQEGVLDGYGGFLELYPTYYFTDRLNLGFILVLTRTPDELIWQEDNLLATFDYTQVDSGINLNWFPVANQELRFKFQWVAVLADLRQAYRSAPTGHLDRSADPVDSFSLSTTGVQLRYRYGLAPLSDLFLVYSRGGDVQRADTREDAGGLFEEGVRAETASQFLVKLRYRFGLL